MMPFAGIFLFAVFWRRINTAGVLACVAAMFVLAPMAMFNSSLISAKHTAAESAATLIGMAEAKVPVTADRLLQSGKALMDNAESTAGISASAMTVARAKMQAADEEFKDLNDAYRADLGRTSAATTIETLRQETQRWQERNAPALLASLTPIATEVRTAMAGRPAAGFLPGMDHPLMRPWLHTAMLMTLVCMAVLVGVSLLTPPPPAEKLVNTTVAGLWGRGAAAIAEDEMLAQRPPWYKDYRLWLSIISAGTAAAWYVMR